MADTDHPFHPDQVSRESGGASPGERKWLAWCEQAEKLLGHDLDGDDVDASGCGYSLDEAHDAFAALQSPEQYVGIVQRRPRYQKPSQD
jgi:hypothetical protein